MIPSGERVIIHFGGDMTVGEFTDMLKADYSVDSSISDQGNSLLLRYIDLCTLIVVET